jgi:WD40 repeat protein
MEKYEEINDPELLKELTDNKEEKMLIQEKKIAKEVDEFSEEEVKGEKAMAVLPFLGALIEPTKHPKINTAEPSVNYKLEYVYGYRSEDSRQNCYYTASGKIAYMTAALGIVLDPKTNTQTFFGGNSTDTKSKFKTSTDCQHNDDILALDISKDRKYCITGQVGQEPKLFVWDVETKAVVSKLNLPKGTRGISAIGFSSDRSMFACADLHNDHNVYVGDVKSGKLIYTEKGGPDKICDLAWCKKDGSKAFLTVGVKHVKMWDAAAKKSNRGIFGKNTLTSFTSCTFGDNGISYSGSIGGSIYSWSGNSCSGAVKAHAGSIHSINYCEGKLISGGADKKIVFSDPAKLTRLSEIVVESSPRALDMVGDKILAGLRNGTIIEIEGGKQVPVMKSHSDGELWGLCIKDNIIATSCDDNRVIVWDTTQRKAITETILNDKPGAKLKYGASTLSTLPDNQCSRALTLNRLNGHIAVGLNDGAIQIRESITNINKVVKSMKDSQRWIECMMYSPDGNLLAVGTHDDTILIYDVKAGYAMKAKFTAHKAAITAVDFTTDSKFLRSNCNAYELLFFNLTSMAQDPNGATNTKSNEWATNNCKISWGTMGTFPPGCDFTHVNHTSLSNDGSLLVCGDDWGLVNLYNFPAVKDGHSKCKALRGHSEHVVRTLFSNDDSHIYSVGGFDRTLMQWKKC